MDELSTLEDSSQCMVIVFVALIRMHPNPQETLY
jgi:hypothetical protein